MGMGNSNTSATWTYYVDVTDPAVTLNSPVNGYNTSSSTVQFNFTVTDNFDTGPSCNLYIDGVLNATNSSVSNNTPTIITGTGITEGHHSWNITCTDNAGNAGDSATRTFTSDQSAPTVSINSPVNYYNTSSATNSINFTFTDAFSPTATCTLYVDGASVASGTEQNNTPAVYSTGSLAEGEHTYYVNCTDNVGNSGVSASRVIRVDLNPPTVNLMAGAPANSTNTTSTTLSVQFNFTDAMSIPGSCYLYVDGSVMAQNTSATNNTLTTLEATGLSEGAHSWYVNCSDQVNRWNVSETRTYNIDLTNPQFAGFVSPIEPGAILNGSVTVYGNFSDYFTGIASVAYALMTGGTNVTPWTGMSLISGNLTQGVWSRLLDTTTVADGTYYILFNITDKAGNYNDTSGVQPVYVDNNPPVIAWAAPANNSALNQYTSYVTVSVNATDAATNITSTTVSVSGGSTDFNQGTSCQSAPKFRVCNFQWNLTGQPDGHYHINVTMEDQASWTSTSTLNVTVDNTPPQISIGSVASAVQIGGKWFTTARETVTVPVTVTDATSGVNFTRVTVVDMANSTVHTCTGTTSVNCQFQPNTSGVFAFNVWANDSAGNYNNTYVEVWVANGLPKQSYDSSKMTLQGANLTTLRTEYSVPIPMYNSGDESLLEGFWVDPIYTDKPVFAGATSMENMAYNYTFQLNATNLNSDHETVTINLTAPGLIPAKVSTQTVYTPEGPVNMTLIAPEMVPGQFSFRDEFTIEYNGTRYLSTGSINTQPITGTFSFDMSTGKTIIRLTVNATNNTVVPVTLYLSDIPPINVTEQTITGFDPTSAPPQLGATINTTYTVNISAINDFYTPDKVYLEFVFPKNVTVVFPNSTSRTFNVSTGVTLKEWNGTAWANATSASPYSACFNVTDSISGSPTNGANITVCFAGYKYKITSSVNDHTDLPQAWIKGKSVALKANTSLTFPAIEEVVPAGTAGANNYSATINMAQQGNIMLTNNDVPGITSANQVSILVDGAPWPGTYQVGSLILLDGTLSPGVHNIKVNYNIPSSGTTTTTGGTISSGTPLGGSATAETGIEPAPSYENTEEVVQTVTTSEELQSALEDVLGEELAGEVLDRLAEQSYQHAGEFSYSAGITSTTQSSTLRVTVRYTGTETLYNVIIYDTVPKDFAADISEVTINAPGATVKIVEADPVVMFVYDEVNPGDELTVDYQASGWKNINIVSEKEAASVFVAGKEEEEQEAEEPVTPPAAEENVTAPEQPAPQPTAPEEKPAPEEVTPAAQDYVWIIAAAVITALAVIIAAVMWIKQQRKPPISRRR